MYHHILLVNKIQSISYFLYFDYIRYIDDIFLTWNKSEEQLHHLLSQANRWHPNIKLEYQISQHLPFLDVMITNANGLLLTSVYHKPSAKPYILPFLSDHHSHVFRNTIQTVLSRAVRYSSTIEIFQKERRCIKLMLLYNGYVMHIYILILTS